MVDSYFCDLPYCICICRSCIYQFTGKFALLFKHQKKHVLTHDAPVLLMDYLHLIIIGSVCLHPYDNLHYLVNLALKIKSI